MVSSSTAPEGLPVAPPDGPEVFACVKWVAPTPEADERFAGISPADQAALEWALQSAEAMGGRLTVVCAGPPAAEAALRDALAVGATRAVRIDVPHGLDSARVAAALRGALGGASLVWCGDHSLDRGTGSVPAYLAAHLGVAQALGVLHVSLAGDGPLEVLRRLDGGRRERLRVHAPAVVSVEGGTARLRRAPLGSALAANAATVTVLPGPTALELVPPALRPYRPRARVLPAPAAETALGRIRELTMAGKAASHGETLEAPPKEAARRILAALAEWGYRS